MVPCAHFRKVKHSEKSAPRSDAMSSIDAIGRVADPDPVFLPGSGSGFQISLDPNPVSASGSGY